MEFTVTVYRLDTPDGAVYVCTDGMLNRLRLDGSETAKVVLAQYEQLLPACQREQYTMRAYTFGERLEAEWQCTEWGEDLSPRVNANRMTLLLLAKSLGRTLEEVAQLHPHLGQLLWTELQMRCNPNPFAWTPSGSKQQSSGTASQHEDTQRSSSSKRGSEAR
jgi:hypothetical protein